MCHYLCYLRFRFRSMHLSLVSFFSFVMHYPSVSLNHPFLARSFTSHLWHAYRYASYTPLLAMGVRHVYIAYDALNACVYFLDGCCGEVTLIRVSRYISHVMGKAFLYGAADLPVYHHHVSLFQRPHCCYYRRWRRLRKSVCSGGFGWMVH